MKILTTKTTTWSFLIFSLFLIIYYLFYVFLQKQSTEFCNNHYCLEILSLGDFISILIAVIGLGLVVHSLDSWKNQDAYHKSRDIYLELSDYIYTCSTGIIFKVMDIPNDLPFNEKINQIKIIIPDSGIGSPISQLSHRIQYENIYYREEFQEISKILEKVIRNIWNTIPKEETDLINIDNRIIINTRNELETAIKLNNQLRDKLKALIS